MNLKAKVYVEKQKKNALAKFAARLALLKEKGVTAKAIQQDAILRKIKALIRKANFRLASIASQEKLNRERAQAKTEKLAAEKAAREKPAEKAEEGVPEKKAKKGKKEKQGKAEPKKEKKEKKGKKEEVEKKE